MISKFFYLGTNLITLADQRRPLVVSCLAVNNGEIEMEWGMLVDWTRAYPHPGKALCRQRGHQRPRVSTAEWNRALAAANTHMPLDCADLPSMGHPPAEVFTVLRTLLCTAHSRGFSLVVHTFSPELEAVDNATDRWGGGSLPDMVVMSTGLLETARRKGLQLKPGETMDDFFMRIYRSRARPPELEECVRQLALEPGVPLGHPLFRVYATHALHEYLCQHFFEAEPTQAARQGSEEHHDIARPITSGSPQQRGVRGGR